MPIDDALDDIRKKERFQDKIKNEKARKFYEAERYLDNGRKIRELKARENKPYLQKFHDEISCGYGFINIDGFLKDNGIANSGYFNEFIEVFPSIDIIDMFFGDRHKDYVDGEIDLQIRLGYSELRTHRNDSDYVNKIFNHIAKLEKLFPTFIEGRLGKIENKNEFSEMAKNAQTPEDIEEILKTLI